MRLLWFNLATDADDPVLGFASRWIQAVAQRVESVHVVTMRAGRVDLPSNVKVYSVGKEKGWSEGRRACAFYAHLLRILREDHIDVCFSHMIQIFTVLAAPLLKLKGIPTVTWYAHPAVTWSLKLAHLLSDRMVTSLPTAYPYHHDKLVVLGQGIDTELFSPDSGIQPANPPVILCVGRLSPVKDHPTLLKAASILCRRLTSPFRIVIVGERLGDHDEAYVRSLHQQVTDLGLQDVVRFQPPVIMADLPSWYRLCRVHINLTPTGFGDKVALEAMACGRPCVVANQGFRETLGDYAHGLLFQHGDPVDLATKLEAAMSMSAADLIRLGVYLREKVVEVHSLQGLAGKLVDLFAEHIISKRAA
jgi:glycosyltransferase involved in cell wall biosynthesis